MAWLPFLQSEGIKPEWEQRYHHLVSTGKSRSTGALDIEKETSEDGEEIGNEEIGDEGEEKYDALELDD